MPFDLDDYLLSAQGLFDYNEAMKEDEEADSDEEDQENESKTDYASYIMIRRK